MRYFNVFGPRQDPEGAYAAVIPKWIATLLKRDPVTINGDGETSRDFCFVQNVVQANLLAATATHPEASNQAYNIAVGQRTTLNELLSLLQAGLQKRDPSLREQKPVYQDFREGDVRHSLADIEKRNAFSATPRNTKSATAWSWRCIGREKHELTGWARDAAFAAKNTVGAEQNLAPRFMEA